MQQKLIDIGWSNVSECQACHKEKGTEKHRLYHCPDWYEARRETPGATQKAGTKCENFKGRAEMTERHRDAPTQRKPTEQMPFQYEHEKHRSWCMPAEGFMGHVATDGSLLGGSGTCEGTPYEERKRTCHKI